MREMMGVVGRIRRQPSSAASDLVEASIVLCRMTARALSDLLEFMPDDTDGY